VFPWAIVSRTPLRFGYEPLNVNVAVTLPDWAVWVVASAAGATTSDSAVTMQMVTVKRLTGAIVSATTRGFRSDAWGPVIF
jgi:hypothetical protein